MLELNGYPLWKYSIKFGQKTRLPSYVGRHTVGGPGPSANRYKYYSLRTEQAYVQSVRMLVKSHGLRHPRTIGQLEIEGFLAMLANERLVAAATHNLALSALLFLYRKVLGMELACSRTARAKRLVPVCCGAALHSLSANGF
jgi:hypothetical protein